VHRVTQVEEGAQVALRLGGGKGIAQEGQRLVTVRCRYRLQGAGLDRDLLPRV